MIILPLGKMPETMKPREKHPSRVVEIPIVEVKPEVPEAKKMSKKEVQKKVGVPVIETVKPQHPKAKLTSLKEEIEESDEDVSISFLSRTTRFVFLMFMNQTKCDGFLQKDFGSDDSEEERPEVEQKT